jgi:hypothetical protein
LSSEANAISKLKKLLESNCVIEKVQPPVMASDAEVKAYREEAVAMREFIRTHQ